MELRDIRYFTAVAEHQNIGRAAETLGLSSTALSKSLRRLEKDVGSRLVRRAPHGVVLTAVGSALLARIGPLQGMLIDVRKEAADLARGNTGHINIGASLGAAENLLADACMSLSRETSKVSLKVTVAGGGASLASAFHKGELDFCVADRHSFSPAEFSYEPLFDDPYVVFASANHRLAKRKQVSLADLVGERWASTSNLSNPQWQQLFAAMVSQGLPPPALALETNSRAVGIPAIAFSGYLGLSSRQYVRKEARVFPLVELRVKEIVHMRHLSVIFRKGGYLSPAALRLIEILKAQAKILPPRKQRGSARPHD